MSNSATPAKPDTTIEFCGKTYPARKFNVQRDTEEIRAHLRTLRGDPLETILPALKKHQDNPAVTKALVDRAYAEMRRSCSDEPDIDQAEIARWIESPAGLAFTTWLIVRDFVPELKDLATVEAMAWQFIQVESDRRVAEAGAKKTAETPSAEPAAPA